MVWFLIMRAPSCSGVVLEKIDSRSSEENLALSTTDFRANSSRESSFSIIMRAPVELSANL